MSRRKRDGDPPPAGSRERRTRSGTPWRPTKKLTPVRLQRPGLRALPARIIALLGKMPDRALAARAGVHHGTIFHERRRRGIAAFHSMSPPVEWTPAMIHQLGTGSDREVAAQLGVSVHSVTRKRRLLGIPPAHPQAASARRGYPWQPEEIALLGKVTDPALAKQLGISTGTVAYKRTQLGIPPSRPKPPPIAWTAAMRRLLGRVPDLEIARRFSINSSSVVQERRRLGIPPFVDRRPIERTPELLDLLRLPASEVRRRTGLNPQTIAKLKNTHGIGSLRPSQLRYGPDVVRRMGKEPDHVIAADLGVSSGAVRLHRTKLGIPAYGGRRRRSKRRFRPQRR
jgi:hypothetical protein